MLHSRIASGGMASVYLGSLTGAADFSRVVAIKRMHPQFASDPKFVERFRAEAWLSCRLLHPNIVQTFDVVQRGSELLLVMEYIDGLTLRGMCVDASAAGQVLPLNVATGILVPVLHGLHAAHVATDDEGRALGIVHRDFSPQNIIIGRDGHAKILDFGIARAKSFVPVTGVGQLSGKFGYLAPEQIIGSEVDQRTDIFAAGIVLWEVLTGERLFREPDLSEASTIARVLSKVVPPPSQFNQALPRILDEILLRALDRDPTQRFATARAMALELETALPVASPSTISNYLSDLSGPRLARLSRSLAGTRRCSAVVSRALAKQSAAPTAAVERLQTVASAAPIFSSVPPSPQPAPARRWARVALLGSVFVSFGILVSVWARGHLVESSPGQRSLGSQPSGGAVASPVVEGAVTPSSAAQSHIVAAETSAQVSALATAMHQQQPNPGAASAPTRARQRVSSRVARPRATTVPRASPGVTGAPSKPMCDPPTYLDSEGIRHFKNGCI